MRQREEAATVRPAPECLPLNDPDVPSHAQVWVLKAGITPERAFEHYGIGWSEALDRVIVPVLADGKRTEEWIGRNSRHGTGDPRTKYLMSAGATGSCWYDLRASTKVVVVVEDVLSAIRVREAGFAAVAVLGTSVSATVASMLADYTAVGWFDNDAAGGRGYVSLRKKAGAFGFRVKRVRSERDPKQYSLREIKEFVENAL